MSEIEYLAIPYTDPSSDIRDYRAEISDIVCADLMNQGRVISIKDLVVLVQFDEGGPAIGELVIVDNEPKTK